MLHLQAGFLFCRLSFYDTLIGCVRKSLRLRKKPLLSSIPSRNTCHNRDAPKFAKVELMNRSCLAKASASEQLGVLSVLSDCISKSLYSSVTNGSFSTVRNFLEAGCLIVLTVDKTTCPVSLLLPKSIQYKGLLR